MKRKILSLILVFAMTVSLLTVGTGAVEPTYGDTAGHWAESSIERWSGHGIIQGSNGQFDPNGQLTCAQLATILAKLLKLPAAKDAGFTDNTADAWYYDAINRCAAAGILNGNGDGTVTPEAPITRERAMVMLARALGIEPIRKPDLTKYTDAAQVSAYAQGYVAALIEAGIVGGVTANELAPQDNINRASTVTILDRAIGVYADKDGMTVNAKDGELVLVVAKNVKVINAPEGTKIVVADGATGLTVNGKSVSDDQTYIVPKTEPAKPSSSSSGGSVHTHAYTTFVTDWSTMNTVKKCSCGATQTIENSNTYYIANDTDLKAFRNKVNDGDAFAGKTIELTANIDLKNEEWTPIGTNEHPFSGIFDGDNKTISNLTITSTGSYNGLFGKVVGIAEGATYKTVARGVWDEETYKLSNCEESRFKTVIKNFSIQNFTIQTGKYGAAAIGWAENAYISNISMSNGSVSDNNAADKGKIAAIVGVSAKNMVYNQLVTANNVSVTGSKHTVAGIVSNVQRGNNNQPHLVVIKDCVNNAAVNWTTGGGTTGGLPIAGIVANAGSCNGLEVVIYKCTNNGTITAGDCNYACGIVGQPGTGVKAVYDCHNTGNITANAYINGVAGICITERTPAIKCSNTGYLVNNATGSGPVYDISGNTSQLTIIDETFEDVGALQTRIDSAVGTSTTLILKDITVSNKEGPLTIPAACTKFTSDNAVCSNLKIDGLIEKVEINMPGSYTLSGTADKEVTISGNATVTNGDANGGKIILTGAIAQIINPSGKTMKAARFDGTGTYTLDNRGTIASNNNHVVSTQSACTITVNNYGMIKTLQSGCYAMLFYDGCTATVNQYPNSSICDESSSGYLLAWAGNSIDTPAESVIYNTYDNNSKLTESWQMAANPEYMLVGSASSQDDLASAISNAAAGKETSIKLTNGTYTLYNVANDKTKGTTLTLTGNGADKTTFTAGDLTVTDANGEGSSDYSYEGSVVTFKGMTINVGTGNYKGFVRANSLYFENCTIEGRGSYWGVGKVVFKNCTFAANPNDYNLWTYSGIDFTFENCIFNTDCGKFINAYKEQCINAKLTFTDCKFVNTNSANKPAVCLKSYTGIAWDVSFTNCTAQNASTDSQTESNLYSIENGMSNDTKVTIDNTVVWQNGAKL